MRYVLRIGEDSSVFKALSVTPPADLLCECCVLSPTTVIWSVRQFSRWPHTISCRGVASLRPHHCAGNSLIARHGETLTPPHFYDLLSIGWRSNRTQALVV